jgi:hypothetical protein
LERNQQQTVTAQEKTQLKRNENLSDRNETDHNTDYNASDINLGGNNKKNGSSRVVCVPFDCFILL